MAGHLTLTATTFHSRLAEEFKNDLFLQTSNFYDRVKAEGFEGTFQRLTSEYSMVEETGVKESHIFFYVGNEQNEEYFEIHLDEEFKIIQVYLVM